MTNPFSHGKVNSNELIQNNQQTWQLRDVFVCMYVNAKRH